jgi:hypothetical protein
MLRWLKRSLVIVPIGVSGFLLFAFLHRDPVLFHIPGDCACTDVSQEVEGFSILNPFRRRAPERAADAFLSDLNAGKCPSNATARMKTNVCALGGDPRLKWRLAYRKDAPDKVSLFYGFRAAPDFLEGSEGVIVMVESEGAWKADEMDVTW